MDLYQDEIVRHALTSTHEGRLDGKAISQHVENRLCGDAVTLWVRPDTDGRWVEVRFESEGCTLCRASASMLCQWLEEKTLEEIRNAIEDISRDGHLADHPALAAFHEVEANSRRRRCITLPWECLTHLVAYAFPEAH